MWRDSKIGKWISLSIHFMSVIFGIYYVVSFMSVDALDYLLYKDYTESTVLKTEFRSDINQLASTISQWIFFAPDGEIKDDLELIRIQKNNGDAFRLTIADLRELKNKNLDSYLKNLDIVIEQESYPEGLCKILYKHNVGETYDLDQVYFSEYDTIEESYTLYSQSESTTLEPSEIDYLYITTLQEVENWINRKIYELSFIEVELKNELQEESNFHYYVTVNNQIFTNNGELENISYNNIAESYKNYYYADRYQESGYDGSYYGVNSLFHSAEEYGKFIAVIDPELNIGDGYQSIAESYSFKHTEALTNVVLLILCFIGWLSSLIYLVQSCGHKKGVDGIYLTYYDKIKSENCLVLTAFTGVFIMSMGFLVDSWYYDYNYDYMIALISVCGILTYFVCLAYFFRFIRRKKAGVRYIDTSILTGVIRFVKRTYENREITTRIIIEFGAYLFLNFINIVFFRYSIFVLVFAVALNGIALYYLIKKGIGFHNISQGVKNISEGDLDYQINTEGMFGDEKILANSINQLGDGLQSAVNMATKNERMKSELITNVSHDIKTPLTSIINYVDLIKREKVENETVNSYINILDQKSQRLKHLIEDLVEASKANTGNIKLDMKPINLVEMLKQTVGEFEDKFLDRNLFVVSNISDIPAIIEADGRRLWRVFENLFNNAYKYSMPGTRIYVDTIIKETSAAVVIKNISESPLNITPNELTERFVRGDVSRTTEGNGLGLSIAKSLTELMGGKLIIYLDGDLFRVTVIFDLMKLENQKTVTVEDGLETDN